MAMDDTPVTQLMTADVLTVTPDTDLTDAADTMLRAGVSSLVVVDDDSHPVGMLTSTDLAKIVSEGESAADATVEQYMTNELVTIDALSSAREASAKMLIHRVHHLPVTDDGTLVGMLSTMDLTAFITYREGVDLD